MIIYAEYLFLENALAGFMILWLTKKLCGFLVSWKRLVVGSILSGIYAFVLFWDSLPWWGGLLSKILFSFGMVVFLFPNKRWKQLARALLIFYIVSFATGGIAIGMMYFFHLTGVTVAGSFYIGQITYLKVLLGIVFAWVGLSIFASFVKEKLRGRGKGVELLVTIGALERRFRGLVDTGNFLVDSKTGKPVSLISFTAMCQLIPNWAELETGKIPNGSALEGRIHWIPYQAIGQKDGLLVGVIPDRITILDEKNGSWSSDFILAVYHGTFPDSWIGEKIEVLLHPAVMEGGILDGEQLEY